MNLEHQARTIREVLPDADVRTDQCEIVRVYLHAEMLTGSIRQIRHDKYEWPIIGLTLAGELSCVTAPPVATSGEDDDIEAARELALKLKLLASQRSS